MKNLFKSKLYNIVFFFLLLIGCTHAQQVKEFDCKGSNYLTSIQKEKLGRGLLAVHQGNGKVSVSWRYLPDDDVKKAFDIYRKTNRKKPVRLNDEPLKNTTYFADTKVNVSSSHKYILKDSGTGQELAAYTLTEEKSRTPYLSIPIQQFPADSLWRYSPNDASIGDLDGDGEMEIILKRENSGRDNSHSGVCNGGTLIEAYKLDGTFMWRIDLGVNIRQGAHYTQMLVYDFDGDGRSELAVKTAEGTQFGNGTVIGDENMDGITDYVDRDPKSRTYGKILKGPEFLSVIEGATGKELARTHYIPRGKTFEFGDNTGNRVDRFLGGVGYFDGQRPSILICRGYYAKTVLEAWDYREGKLTKRWKFSTTDNNGQYKDYEGQGNHSLAIGDVDGDGKDEVTYGACLIEEDGSGGYNTELGHGDAMHLTDIDIERPGLELWDCHEHVPTRAGSELRDACTGALIWGIPSVEDVGRAMAADIDPRFKGLELWTTHSGGVYTANGELISQRTPSINMGLWWDGDLNRELLDGSGVRRRERVTITKWNGNGVDNINLPNEKDLAANNWTKANPCLQADIVGDWREEILVRTKDNKEIRLYMTPYETPYRFHTLLSDHMYRLTVAIQNVGYNQPTQLGYYLGSDLGKFWNNHYRLKRGAHSKSGRSESGHINDMNTRYEGAQRIVQDTIRTHAEEYVLDAGYEYDDYKWMVNKKEVNADRKLILKASDYSVDDEEISVELEALFKGFIFKEHVCIKFSE